MCGRTGKYIRCGQNYTFFFSCGPERIPATNRTAILLLYSLLAGKILREMAEGIIAVKGMIIAEECEVLIGNSKEVLVGFINVPGTKYQSLLYKPSTHNNLTSAC